MILSNKLTLRAQQVVAICLKEQITLGLAESCTGGMLASTLVDVPGVSQVLTGSITAYNNEIKSKALGVREDTIRRFGAVSQEVAEEMADCAKKVLNSTFGVAITGIAGPQGRSETKPIGLVFIAVAGPSSLQCKRNWFRPADRMVIRQLSVLAALNLCLTSFATDQNPEPLT